jgi:hypothetical protein
LPYGVSEVVKLYQGGIDKDVIVSYVNNSSLPYHLTADGILYLHSLGIPEDITKAITQRDGALQQQQAVQQQFYQQQPMPAVVQASNGMVATESPGRVVTPSTPPPDITVIGSDNGYDYPYYDYGDYGPPLVVGGWGWGYGWGHGGFLGGYRGFHGGGAFGGSHAGGGFGGSHGGGGFHGGFGGGHGGGGGHR